MVQLPAPLLRGLTVLALGATLALTHIAFAAAHPVPGQPAGDPETKVETTSSVSPRQELAENCYIDLQAVKGVRGKTVLVRVHECD